MPPLWQRLQNGVRTQARWALERPLVINAFHRAYYYAAQRGRTWHDTKRMDIPVWKCPLDLWA